MNHAPLITGHALLDSPAPYAPLDFTPDTDVAARVRAHLASRRAEMDRLAGKADNKELPVVRVAEDLV